MAYLLKQDLSMGSYAYKILEWSQLCPLCKVNKETVEHLFISSLSLNLCGMMHHKSMVFLSIGMVLHLIKLSRLSPITQLTMFIWHYLLFSSREFGSLEIRLFFRIHQLFVYQKDSMSLLVSHKRIRSKKFKTLWKSP